MAVVQSRSPAQPDRRGLARFEVAIVAGGQFVQLFLTFGTSMLIARTLKSDGFGVVNLLRTIFMMVATLAPLGLDAALLKYCGKSRGDDPQMIETVGRLRLLAGVVNLAIITLGVFAAWTGLVETVYPYDGVSHLFVVTLVALPFATQIAILGAVYKASGRAAHYALITLYLQSVARVVMVCYAVVFSPTIPTIVWINTLQVVISAVVLMVHERGWRPARATGAALRQKAWAEARIVLGESAWMAVALFVYGIMRMVDVLVLGAFVDSKSVGEYTALSTIAQLIQFYPLAASQSLGPSVSRLFHNGDVAGVERELSSYIRQAAIVAGFLFAGIAVFGDRLDLVFGQSFHFQPLVCLLLPLGQVLGATLAPTGYALSMTGRHRQETWILSAGAVILVLSCLVLVPRFGQAGAAAAACVTFFLVNLARFAYVAKILGRVPGRLMDLVPPLSGLALALVAREVGDLVGRRDFPTTMLSCVLYAVAFAGVAYAFFLNETGRAQVARRLRLR